MKNKKSKNVCNGREKRDLVVNLESLDSLRVPKRETWCSGGGDKLTHIQTHDHRAQTEANKTAQSGKGASLPTKNKTKKFQLKQLFLIRNTVF